MFFFWLLKNKNLDFYDVGYWIDKKMGDFNIIIFL